MLFSSVKMSNFAIRMKFRVIEFVQNSRSEMWNIISRHLPFLLCVFVVAVWGETFVSSKILLQRGLFPAEIFFFRFLLAYLLMVIVSHGRMWADSLRDETLLMAGGVFGGSLYFLAENLALEYSTASNVAILVGTTPLATALLLALFYRDERMSGRQVVGSLIAFCGLVLVVLNGRLVLHLNPVGDMLALVASLLWGLYSLVMKNLMRRYEPRFVTRKVFGYGLLTILPWFFLVQPIGNVVEMLAEPVVWGNLLYLGMVASLLCYLLWHWALPRVGVVRATNLVYTQCAFTMVISSIVLDERITMMAVFGTVILILGMMLMSRKGVPN